MSPPTSTSSASGSGRDSRTASPRRRASPSTSAPTTSVGFRLRPGDRVLDVGAGPGRFTIELARLGADVVVVDLSPRQLELNREKVAEAGLEERVVERVLADVTDLSRFADASFDVTVCFGGPAQLSPRAGRGRDLRSSSA